MRETMLMAATATSPPPNSRPATLRRMVATLARACRQKEGRPPEMILEYRSTVGRNARRERGRLSPWNVPPTSRQKLRNWLRMVARAAPPVSISRTKMKMGSRMMLTTAPEKMPTMPKMAFP